MIHKHRGRWTWQGSASVVSWNWELLSFQTGFSLVSTDVVCAVLENISGLEPSSVISEPRYFKLVTVSSFCPFALISVLMPLVLLLSAWSSRHWSLCRRPWRLYRNVQLSLPVLLLPNLRCYQQSRDRWLFCFIADSDILTFLSVCHNLLQKYVGEGESRHPRRTPTVVRNQSPMLLLERTALVALS